MVLERCSTRQQSCLERCQSCCHGHTSRKVTHTCWIVVADGEVRSYIRFCVAEGTASHGRTANANSVVPDNLREMSPILKVGHVRTGNTPWQWIQVDLSAVHLVGEHSANIIGRSTSADILAIATTTSSPVAKHQSMLHKEKRGKQRTYCGHSNKSLRCSQRYQPRYHSKPRMEKSDWHDDCCVGQGSSAHTLQNPRSWWRHTRHRWRKWKR